MLDTGIADSSDATVLTFDSSENALFHGHVDLGDGQRIRFGDSDDYHIHHNANGVTYVAGNVVEHNANTWSCLLYTSPSPRDKRQSRMPSSA